jgi:N-acyl-D-amino-acid deacylase
LFDIIINNCRIIDGTGNPWYKGHIGVSNGKISKINHLPLKGADRTIDAHGRTVSPGFINIHSHSDGSILTHNKAENCVAMGITTEIVGCCGVSAAPITDEYRDMMNESKSGTAWGFYTDIDWLSLGDWFNKVQRMGIGINLGSLVGHGTIRGCVMGIEGEGGDRIVPNETELKSMKMMIKSAMRDGAFGLSTGLNYPLGRNSLTEELVELLRVVAKSGGVHFSHMRNEADLLIEATKEFIETCEKTGVRGSISHHKAAGPENFGKTIETLQLIDDARKRGVDIIIDLYPWRIGGLTKSLGSRFRTSLPNGTSILTRKELVENLSNPEVWMQIKKKLLDERENNLKSGEDRKKRLEEKGGWMAPPSYSPVGVILYSKNHPELEGKTLKEVDEILGNGEDLEGQRVLLIDDEGYTVSGNYPFSEKDICRIIKYPWSTLITDQRAIDNSKYSYQDAADRLAMEHPRGWGTYPKYLGSYVREKNILTIEEAIRKITSLPASLLRVPDRGLIKEGFWADLVIFDPDTIKSNATYMNPFAFPTGLSHVLVNGELAKDNNKLTGALSGKIIKRQ